MTAAHKARKREVLLKAAAMTLAALHAFNLGATPPRTISRAEAPRQITFGESYRFKSLVLGDTRIINVLLPQHYKDRDRAFPVLFLLDGGEQEDFFHLASLAQINAAYGQGQELIVVGIEGVDRRHDLTSRCSNVADCKVAPTSGGADRYRKFLGTELKPWVAAKFRTNGRSAIIGESLAGLFVLETFLNSPDSFSDYISVSPSLWWNGGSTAAHAAQALKTRTYSGSRIWIAFDVPAPPAAVAAKEFAQQGRLEQAFQVAKPPGLRWTIFHSREGHGSIYHPAAVQAFRHLFGTPAR